MPFLVRFVPKVCKSVIAHHTPVNEPHARTFRTLFRMDFARTRATAHRNSYLGNISENSPSDGRKLCRFVKKCHEHVINESITWTSSGIHPIDLCRFVLLSFWLRDRYCLKTFSDVLCPRNSLIKEFLFHGFGYAENYTIGHFSFMTIVYNPI